MTQKQREKHRLEKNKKPISNSLPAGWNGGPAALKSASKLGRVEEATELYGRQKE